MFTWYEDNIHKVIVVVATRDVTRVILNIEPFSLLRLVKTHDIVESVKCLLLYSVNEGTWYSWVNCELFEECFTLDDLIVVVDVRLVTVAVIE